MYYGVQNCWHLIPYIKVESLHTWGSPENQFQHLPLVVNGRTTKIVIYHSFFISKQNISVLLVTSPNPIYSHSYMWQYIINWLEIECMFILQEYSFKSLHKLIYLYYCLFCVKCIKWKKYWDVVFVHLQVSSQKVLSRCWCNLVL